MAKIILSLLVVCLFGTVYSSNLETILSNIQEQLKSPGDEINTSLKVSLKLQSVTELIEEIMELSHRLVKAVRRYSSQLLFIGGPLSSVVKTLEDLINIPDKVEAALTLIENGLETTLTTVLVAVGKLIDTLIEKIGAIVRELFEKIISLTPLNTACKDEVEPKITGKVTLAGKALIICVNAFTTTLDGSLLKTVVLLTSLVKNLNEGVQNLSQCSIITLMSCAVHFVSSAGIAVTINLPSVLLSLPVEIMDFVESAVEGLLGCLVAVSDDVITNIHDIKDDFYSCIENFG